MKNTFVISALAFSIALSYSFNHAPLTRQQSIFQEPAAKEQTYRLIVSFTSKGGGANSEQRKAFLEYVAGYSENPVYKTVNWGREGETDYCFTLAELSAKQQTDFVAEVKKIVSPSPLAFVEENAVCKHHGRLQTKN